MSNPKVVQGISFNDQGFLNSAQRRASRLGVSFSHYIRMLINDDLKESGAKVLTEQDLSCDSGGTLPGIDMQEPLPDSPPIMPEEDPPALLAIFHQQHPLTGGAVPVVRRIRPDTTVEELMDWHRQRCQAPDKWKPSWFDLRLITEYR